MSEERSVVEFVARFLLQTWQPSPQLNTAAINALLDADEFDFRCETDQLAPDIMVILLTVATGSVAELYIRPMLSCIGDVDIMYHASTQLAIPQATLPPRQLPAEFHRRVHASEIIDSPFPGYVYLVLTYLLTECADEGIYHAKKCWPEYARHSRSLVAAGSSGHEPAQPTACSVLEPTCTLIGHIGRTSRIVDIDIVPCMRCLSWPTQAADWPTRQRHYGWPDAATVDRVVSNGCDVVCAAHRLCKHDEWIAERQWRLSFSRAEVVLLQSWTPIQQIVYHMLRVFAKKELRKGITYSPETSMLSNYHLKTLMMWACELRSRSWWTEGLNIVGMCVELLHILGFWLTGARCQHYFIGTCNLMDYNYPSLNCQMTAEKLRLLTNTLLAEWFVDNYLWTCIEHYGKLFMDFRVEDYEGIRRYTKDEQVRFTETVVGARRFFHLHETWTEFTAAELVIASHVSRRAVTVQSCFNFMRNLANSTQSLSTTYYTAVVFLHVVHRERQGTLTDELLDVLTIICLQSNDVRCFCSRNSGPLLLNKATKLMKVVANNPRSTVQLIEIELAKAYLYRALNCKDSDNDSIYCLANVYLAVLYYTTGQYQTAIDHCTPVTRSQDHSQCSSHVVQGYFLPKLDENIDGVLGLTVYYRYVRIAALHGKQKSRCTNRADGFTASVFASHLKAKCFSLPHHHRKASFTAWSLQYRKCLCQSAEIFISDVLAFKLVTSKLQCVLVDAEDRSQSLIDDTWKLEELLERSAVERLTTFRQLELQQFDAVAGIHTTDFEALYAYKRGDYQRCLDLSAHSVRLQLERPAWHQIPFVLAFPEFIQLMDDEIVCVIGLAKIADRACSALISQLGWSLYLTTQCHIKLCHPATSVAQTLDYVESARCRHHKLEVDETRPIRSLDKVMLKFTEKKVLALTTKPGNCVK